MRPLIQQIQTVHTPESLVENLRGVPGIVLLRTSQFDSPAARYSFVTASPFLSFRSFGSRCEIRRSAEHSSASPSQDADEARLRAPVQTQFGNPWHLLDALMSRFELLDEIDLPFPLGGAFGYWGYDLKNFTEPKLPRRAVNDLELPDCHVGFYDSLVVFDHQLGKVFIVSTGLDADGSRSESRAKEKLEFWRGELECGTPGTAPARSEIPQPAGTVPGAPNATFTTALSLLERARENSSLSLANPNVGDLTGKLKQFLPLRGERAGERADVLANFSKADFLAAVERAQRYIRAGDIYQVNLSQRLTAEVVAERQAPTRYAESAGHAGSEAGAPSLPGWELFQKLNAVSPAPFAAFLDGGEFQVASSSPEQFLRLSGSHIQTRPIKGTRPRDSDATRDLQLAHELQTSAKELAELVMITDLSRNDLGRVCEYGSVQVPELAKLEKFAQVQHLVSTVEGRLRNNVTHFAAFASCFPGGSITGAPKFRAMEIIDELEPISRGPYCGAIGYLGFNRESQLNIAIRTAVCKDGLAHFNVGAGIVADSNPEAEYEETLAKAAGFLAALEMGISRRQGAQLKAESEIS